MLIKSVVFFLSLFFMNVDTQIQLNRFKPRSYQLPILDAIENKNYKRVLVVMPRRAGKDVCAFNLMIRAALKRIGVYYYIFPTYSQAKKVIWDSITNSGERFLDYIPKELVKSSNGHEMKITLNNGSIIQLVGSDNVDSLVGTNPRGCVFSEYALQDPRAYQFLRPILLVNDGWALFISTPRGKNHMYDLYQIAKQSSDWFCYKLSVEDTQHISLHEIEKERAEGLMSDDLIQQEYFCSFELGVEGSYYAKYIDKMRIKGQIGLVPYETGFKVHTAWDIGVRDSTTIIFFQVVGQVIHIIDCYENSKVGLEHFVKVIEQKPYTYGKHIGPHDIKVKEWGSGMTRIEKAKQLGILFTVAPDLSVEDGIESVRSALSKIWIDEKLCAPLLKSLENYRQEYDVKRKTYKSNPLHDWASHWADALRYLCISLPKTRDGLSAEELDKRYRQAMYGEESMPGFFKDESRRIY
jgi:phage terminase large subunit